jgi:5-methylthioribose kinase
MTPDEWLTVHPDVFYLDPLDVVCLERWLERSGTLAEGESVRAAVKAGEGNMNCTLRVTTDRRSIIVKQARPWVEKYPQFAAPWDRALCEMEFFALVESHAPVAARMPRLLHADEAARVLVLEDLGRDGDYSDVYQGVAFTSAEVETLAEWLGGLHRAFRDAPDRRGLANREMRRLNSHHMFFIPLQSDNGLDLDAITPGLADEAQILRHDSRFVAEIHILAADYLADGPCLLHGDFFPGSLLRTPHGPFIIDPEFTFFGCAEFDAGVFLAHLLLSRQPAAVIDCFLAGYAGPTEFDERLMLRFAGLEVMRRLIGYAQLPIPASLQLKRRLLLQARNLVVAPSREIVNLPAKTVDPHACDRAGCVANLGKK